MELTGQYEGYKVVDCGWDSFGGGSRYTIYDPDNPECELVKRGTVEAVERYIDNRIKRLEKGEIGKRIKQNVITVQHGVVKEFTATGATTNSSWQDALWVMNVNSKTKSSIDRKLIYLDNEPNRDRAKNIREIGNEIKTLHAKEEDILSKMDMPDFGKE